MTNIMNDPISSSPASAKYDLMSENPESTVVAEFEAGYFSAAQYQTEADMERDFIDRLKRQGYEYLPINTEAELIANLRRQIERLNGITFADDEWRSFFDQHIGNPNMGIVEKTATIQEDHRKTWTRPDGSVVNLMLIDKDDIHHNSLQVIHQYTPEGGAYANRYDVTILVNGLPMVHVELKRRGVSIKEAFNQINRYQRESFWAGKRLFEFVQIFVISNGTLTKYYSNTTRVAAERAGDAQAQPQGKRMTSNSYEFTSYWATKDNTPIHDLTDFTQTFLSKHTLLNVLTRYCVFTADRMLMVMRPYQIAATEEILLRVRTSSHAKTLGTRQAGGYIWHTTGSGKTLTSFKTATLAQKLPDIDKVLFVVDRKDLDYQTMMEYDKFGKGAANSNVSTAMLQRQLEDPNAKILITTIQKLSRFIQRSPRHSVYDSHVVLIFDECHRSQFGEMHRAITKKFKRHHMFGFTGTPIFPENSRGGVAPDLTTTEGAFGDKLHSYTIVDAIRDGNVLPFKVDYVRTLREEEQIADEQVSDIDRERALMAPKRIELVSNYILTHFAEKTRRGARAYDFAQVLNVEELATAKGTRSVKEVKVTKRLRGFNSIFAVESIPFARLYYTELQRQNALLPPDRRLKIATIYSYAPNADIEDESPDGADGLDQSSREFLDACIRDYNAMFQTNYDTSADKFQAYYKDLSRRVKNREVDLLIVVNMFLTGFDATTLNTLWVDKSLRHHGLIQAFSRTNRILNSIKDHGQIVCFRNLEKATNDALKMFGDSKRTGVVILRPFADYYEGYDEAEEEGADIKHYPGWRELIHRLLEEFPLGKTIVGETAEKAFIRLFGTILRAFNLLQTFDDFEGKHIISDEDFMDYRGLYNELHDKYRPQAGARENINDDLVFEMELMKSIEINIDYILFLVGLLNGDHGHDAEIKLKAMKSVQASPDLRNKKELIEEFILQHTPQTDVHDEWHAFVRMRQQRDIEEIISSEGLRRDKTLDFMEQSFRDGGIREGGTAIADILPPMGLFGSAGAARAEKKRKVTQLLKDFFDRYYDFSGSIFYRPE